MNFLIEKLETRLKPRISEGVKERLEEIIELADNDVLDLIRPRNIEQEVLDIIDEIKTN
ncbi:hypothetical protein ISS22_01235 [candidate division KSB1 bacterium]|nr:hypothetical protein [candidate division KSB1 bacterium]